MQIRPDQLAAHLEKGLSPVYLIHGEEILVQQEAADAVRHAARQAGYTEREVFSIEPGFDWNRVVDASNILSLFAERRILELRMPTGRPGDAGTRVLQQFTVEPSPDTLLLVVTGKLDANQRRTRWYKAFESGGVTIACWSVDAQRLPGWIRQRMRVHGVRPTREAVELLVQRVEGNLLACAQEVEKLCLLNSPGELDAGAIVAAVVDSARFDVFELVDSALSGDGGRTVRIVNGLRGEGVEPPLVTWALARELRQLEIMARCVAEGQAVGQVLKAARVWQSRQAVVGTALKRYQPVLWQALLSRCARIDQVTKGQVKGNAWDELVQLLLHLAGSPLSLAVPGSSV
jgi:DNA polymerase-3 subunit delta